MPPRRNPTKHRILCTCSTYKCGTKQYWLDGRWQRGNLIVSQIAQLHRLEDQALSAGTNLEAIHNQPLSSSSEQVPEYAGSQTDEASALAAVTHSLALTRIESARAPDDPLSLNVYDTSRWMISPFQSTPPAFTYAMILGTMFAVLQPVSQKSSSWLLRSQRDLIQLTMRDGYQTSFSLRPLTAAEEILLEKLPVDTRTTTKQLNLDPVIFQLNCCPRCFATYPLDWTPMNCIHREDSFDESAETIKTQPYGKNSKGPMGKLSPASREI
ncbi:hypothetical protein VP01_3638g3 [Puccinia sorghi]|uniref:Uncharacterized protein n=1 Tax=Puccinia sorghi TaxID=27349 RepID=A0A0L6UUN2_9BASI|nr:hypothetical protein VP01_3638g3 [Puccinia sorghi]